MPSALPTIPPRLTHRPFPPYAHRPGLTPHPITDPRGHSYRPPGSAEKPHDITPLDSSSLAASEPYRYAIDLYNACFWWEAHEEWESLWHIARAQGQPGELAASFLRGLIQAAAFQLKVIINEQPGSQRLLARLTANFAPVAASIAPARCFAGVDIAAFVESLRQQFDRAEPGDGRLTFLVLESPSAPALPQ